MNNDKRLLHTLYLVIAMSVMQLAIVWNFNRVALPSIDKESGINVYRENHGLGMLRVNEELCDFANIRLKDIKTDFNHDKFFTRDRPAGSLGENLAKGFSTEGDVIIAWNNSPTHKDILVSDWSEYCLERDQSYWVLTTRK